MTSEITGIIADPTQLTIVNLPIGLEPVLFIDREDISVCTPSLLSIEMQNHIFNSSTIRRMRLCGRFSRCLKRICPHCARKIAKKAHRDIRRHAAKVGLPALYIVLSVKSNLDPSQGLNDLAMVRRELLDSGYLKSVSHSWFRFTEVTLSTEGWHWHDNWVVFGTPDQLGALEVEIESQWLGAAKTVEVDAGSAGVHVQDAYDIYGLARYVSKGLMKPAKAGESPTPGDILAASYSDPAALALWHSLEALWAVRAPSLVSRSRLARIAPQTPVDVSGRKPRGKSITAEMVSELETGRTPAQIAQLLGCSVRTVQNRRKELAALRSLEADTYGLIA